MTFGIAVKTLDSAGGVQTSAPSPDWFYVDDQPVVCQGDIVTSHPPVPPHTTSPTMAEGSTWMSLNGVPACREGHKAICGHATTGRPWFLLPD